MGAQGVILDDNNQVLLIRHGYHPGWHFPGGGVEWNEPAQDALGRELREEAGVVLTGEPELHGVFANFKIFPGDHVMLYVVRRWEQPAPPELGVEIAEWGLFPLDDLPDGVSEPVKRRLAEIIDGQAVSLYW